jgi:hypothetical protein
MSCDDAVRSNHSTRSALSAALLCLLLAAGASAQGRGEKGEKPTPVAIRATFMVTHVMNGEGEIDPRARELVEKLRRQNIRYPQARVLLERQTRLSLNQLETLALPDGRKARFRPLQVGPRGVLLAVDVEQAVKMDARVRKGHMLVIDGGRYEDGKIVISVVPDYD